MKMRLKFPKSKLVKIYHEEFQYKWFEIQNEVAELGEKTLDHMRQTIANRTKRTPATGNLARSIEFELIDRTGKIHFGIGKISDLMNSAPYYFVVNYGKMMSGQEYIPYHGNDIEGSFDGSPPMPGKDGQRFEKGGRYKMTPKKPIRPMGYIEEAERFFKSNLRKLMKKFGKK